MTTEKIILAANSRMAEIRAHSYDCPEDRTDALRDIWVPLAEELGSLPVPAHLAALAEELGSDFVGVTSDGGRLVCWAPDDGGQGTEFRLV